MPRAHQKLMENQIEEMERLREQLRKLNTENEGLKREINKYQKRVPTDELTVGENEFIITGTMGTDFLNAAVEKTKWCQLSAQSDHVITLFTETTFFRNDKPTTILANTTRSSEIIRISSHSPSLSQRRRVGNWQTVFLNSGAGVVHTMKTNIKIVRSSIVFPMQVEDEELVRISLGNETIIVNTHYLSAWSEFLRGYFASKMRESESGVYPIEDWSIIDFREMLQVISPTAKPIDVWNVEKMLELADRFIMPSLTLMCEIFLNDRLRHNFTEIKILLLAEKYRLYLTKNIILEKMTPQQLRSKIIRTEEYGSLTEDMKRSINARYVELHVKETEGE